MKRDLDFIYKDEIEHAVGCGALSEFHPAFSHEQVRCDSDSLLPPFSRTLGQHDNCYSL